MAKGSASCGHIVPPRAINTDLSIGPRSGSGRQQERYLKRQWPEICPKLMKDIKLKKKSQGQRTPRRVKNKAAATNEYTEATKHASKPLGESGS